jgi:hypothetical protein
VTSEAEILCGALEEQLAALAHEVRAGMVQMPKELLALNEALLRGLVPFMVPASVEAALHAVILALQQNRHFRQQVLLACGRLQQHFKRGPLTDLIQAVAGGE